MREVCANGHPWTQANVYVNPKSGWRLCRPCHRESYTRMRARVANLSEVELIAAMSPAAVDLFWSKVDKGEDCWLWTAARRASGYGAVAVGGRSLLPHRVSFLLSGGVILAGLHIDHLCRVRKCVRPGHLEPVTSWENQLRSPISVSARNSAKTHCIYGHAFDSINTNYRSDGSRECRSCKQRRQRAARGKVARS